MLRITNIKMSNNCHFWSAKLSVKWIEHLLFLKMRTVFIVYKQKKIIKLAFITRTKIQDVHN